MDVKDFQVPGDAAASSRPSQPTGVAELDIPWIVPIEHLSATSLSMYLRCPEQFRHRYILGEKKKPGEALVLGTAVHSTWEKNFREKIETHEDLSQVVLQDYFSDEAWGDAITQQQESTGEEVQWDDADEAHKRGRKMVAAYRQEVSARVQPITVEERVEIGGLGPVPVIGYIDIETDALAIDLKTAKQKRKVVKPDWQLQGRIYSLAKTKPIDFHILAPTGTVTPLDEPGLSIAPTTSEVGAVEMMIRATAERIERDYMTYGPEGTWPTYGTVNEMYNKSICSWCGWRGVCPAGGEL